MNRTARHRMAKAFVVMAALAVSTACTSDAPVGPNGQSVSPANEDVMGVAPIGTKGPAVSAKVATRMPDLGACQNLSVAAGSKLVKHVYAEGVQIYQWNGASWAFVAPLAVMSADAAGNGIIGTHYAGPTWESLSGGTVVGAVVDRCTPDATAVPWLLLSAVSDGPGIFHRVDFIQRLNTAGGIAPAYPGSFVGQEARVPYTTEYLFYRTN